MSVAQWAVTVNNWEEPGSTFLAQPHQLFIHMEKRPPEPSYLQAKQRHWVPCPFPCPLSPEALPSSAAPFPLVFLLLYLKKPFSLLFTSLTRFNSNNVIQNVNYSSAGTALFEPCVVNRDRKKQTEQENSITSRSWGRSEPLAYWLRCKHKMTIKLRFRDKVDNWRRTNKAHWFPRNHLPSLRARG